MITCCIYTLLYALLIDNFKAGKTDIRRLLVRIYCIII